MTGHRPFAELTKSFTPERRARIAAKAASLREQMTLEGLRTARNLSQGDVAASLAWSGPAVADFETLRDVHIGNLRRYVEALGGTLEITAHFSDSSVLIGDLGDPTSAP